MEVLLFTVGRQRCALPLDDVSEVLRSQPLTSHDLLPSGVLGTSVIRDRPTAVVDAGLILAGTPSTGTRWVLLRCGDRAVALAVDAVSGTVASSDQSWTKAPALISGPSPRDDEVVDSNPLVRALGILDSELVQLLSGIRVLAEAESAFRMTSASGENGSPAT